MSENNNKRKEEESMLEKMDKLYKKMKKMEDHIYFLKKSATSKTHHEAESLTKDDETQIDPGLADLLQLAELGTFFLLLIETIRFKIQPFFTCWIKFQSAFVPIIHTGYVRSNIQSSLPVDKFLVCTLCQLSRGVMFI